MEIFAPGSISEWVWDNKYRLKEPDGTPIDKTVSRTFERVANAIAENEPEADRDYWRQTYFEAMSSFEFLPAGRILAGAGTGRDVTLCNCYVMGTIEDSLDGIMKAAGEAAATLKTGGGVGMDFSTLRPRGAIVAGVGSTSSGAVSFMDIWHAMCGTIMSAGTRRGAMMGTLRVDHPDIEEFIEAKQQAGRLTNFNVSVLVTDRFMGAVEADTDFPLVFKGETYRTVKARELWDKILRATYEHAEPGVIFIDRVNEMNPLQAIETIAATNPCGEQPLPPYGACILGSINLARLVLHPFTKDAHVDEERLRELTALGVRFLDNVVDLSKYPLPKQAAEARDKRRIGLGFTGMADALAMLDVEYGGKTACDWTRRIMQIMHETARKTSIALGEEKGVFPLWQDGKGMGPARRNSHLLSIAPTGTISLFAGNVSSGIEPIFSLSATRAVLMPDGSRQEFDVEDYAYRLREATPGAAKHGLFNKSVASAVTVERHLAMVAAAQPFVDSSISKTINCPAEMTFGTFRQVYDIAFDEGLKGCTTYRPSKTRGAVLVDTSSAKEPVAEADNVVRIGKLLERGEELAGKTYKIKPAGEGHALYVTINDIEHAGQRRPFEIFFSSKNIDGYAWTVALSRMISAVFRKGGDVSFVSEELRAVFDPRGGFWMDGKYVPSLCAAIGDVIAKHMKDIGFADEAPVITQEAGRHCPKCQRGRVVRHDGCWSCDSCDYTQC